MKSERFGVHNLLQRNLAGRPAGQGDIEKFCRNLLYISVSPCLRVSAARRLGGYKILAQTALR